MVRSNPLPPPVEGVDRGGTGVEGVESGVEGAGSGDRGGGEPGKIGAGN